jgi:succinate-acetate transporter protein
MVSDEIKLANPAPLGLMGFGMTTVLLNLHNAGFFPLNAMILAMGIFYGGLAQILAGLMEFRKGNTFGVVAFSSYGLFWLSLVFVILLPRIGWGEVPNELALASYFFMWGLFTLFMFIGTLKKNGVLMFIFLSLAILFFLLTAREMTSNVLIGTIAGYEGMVCGFSAIYLSIAEVLNETYNRTVLPVLKIKS